MTDIIIDLSDGDISKRDLLKHPDDRSITFDKSIEAINFINQKFRHVFPWMYMFTLYKSDGKRIIFNWMRSIPFYDITRSHSDANSIIFEGRWSGDNVDDFFIQSKKDIEREKIDKALDLGSSEEWSVVKDKKPKKHYVGSLSSSNEYYDEVNDKPKKYASRMVMSVNQLEYIYVYNWGFELQSESPIDIVCIKRKSLIESSLKKSSITESFSDLLMNNSSKLNTFEHSIVQDIMEKESFTLPSEVSNIKTLRGFWSNKDTKEQAEETDSWLLGEFGKTKPEINVGQEVNENIIL